MHILRIDLLEILNTSQPYDVRDKQGRERFATMPPMKVTAQPLHFRVGARPDPLALASQAACALKELLCVEEVTPLAKANFSPILSVILLRLGCSAGLKTNSVELLWRFARRGGAVGAVLTFYAGGSGTDTEPDEGRCHLVQAVY